MRVKAATASQAPFLTSTPVRNQFEKGGFVGWIWVDLEIMISVTIPLIVLAISVIFNAIS